MSWRKIAEKGRFLGCGEVEMERPGESVDPPTCPGKPAHYLRFGTTQAKWVRSAIPHASEDVIFASFSFSFLS